MPTHASGHPLAVRIPTSPLTRRARNEPAPSRRGCRQPAAGGAPGGVDGARRGPPGDRVRPAAEPADVGSLGRVVGGTRWPRCRRGRGRGGGPTGGNPRQCSPADRYPRSRPGVGARPAAGGPVVARRPSLPIHRRCTSEGIAPPAPGSARSALPAAPEISDTGTERDISEETGPRPAGSEGAARGLHERGTALGRAGGGHGRPGPAPEKECIRRRGASSGARVAAACGAGGAPHGVAVPSARTESLVHDMSHDGAVARWGLTRNPRASYSYR